MNTLLNAFHSAAALHTAVSARPVIAAEHDATKGNAAEEIRGTTVGGERVNTAANI